MTSLYHNMKNLYHNMKSLYHNTSLYVTGSAKRGLIADPNSTHLESHNLTCEFGTTLKLDPNIPLLCDLI